MAEERRKPGQLASEQLHFINFEAHPGGEDMAVIAHVLAPLRLFAPAPTPP